MKMALLQTLAASSVALSMCIPAARAAEEITLRGKGVVESVNASRERFVVRIARLPKPLTLAWDKDTQFQRGKEPATASALATGQEIEIRYQLASSGRHHATRIVILSEPGANKETTSAR
jgi:hypothetical protein